MIIATPLLLLAARNIGNLLERIDRASRGKERREAIVRGILNAASARIEGKFSGYDKHPATQV